MLLAVVWALSVVLVSDIWQAVAGSGQACLVSTAGSGDAPSLPGLSVRSVGPQASHRHLTLVWPRHGKYSASDTGRWVETGSVKCVSTFGLLVFSKHVMSYFSKLIISQFRAVITHLI